MAHAVRCETKWSPVAETHLEEKKNRRHENEKCFFFSLSLSLPPEAAGVVSHLVTKVEKNKKHLSSTAHAQLLFGNTDINSR